MNLLRLIDALPDYKYSESIDQDTQVTGIAHDSRRVFPGEVFVAISGHSFDGHNYIPQAIRNGAVAIVGEQSLDTSQIAVPYFATTNTRIALASLAAAYYEYPARKLRVIGVTGTDGKTTTSILVHAILTQAGYKTAIISTINALVNEEIVDTGVHVTTPNALELQKLLAKILNTGATHVVLETTSHALAQNRVHECDYDVAVITNISHEHFDYHGTYENYLNTKAQLFFSLNGKRLRDTTTPKISILNIEDDSYDYLSKTRTDEQWTYGLTELGDFSAKEVSMNMDGTVFTINTPLDSCTMSTKLIGKHNIYNVLAAIAVCYTQGIDLDVISRGISSVEKISARMERIDCGQDYDVFVDYAHTPNALKNILNTARQLSNGELILVFGLSGGYRDETKRPDMGRIAGELADKVIITSVDWYKEDIVDIIEQIAEGCELSGKIRDQDYWCTTDRQCGIELGIQLAKPGDIVVIAGKGHETSISRGGVDLPWSEIETAENAIKNTLQPSP
ncbi:MAG: UDP-N-acetylmuramoyl-L-alanyl-D-glutamate--2,6-diaminopimelate ligase [Bacteroidetes bacterium]|nr:UDP-N-acetylmuramoyl-L-alanyl-D-glutamate--2,6-diaminopimelate ligase [Bacteroidota bacterium]